MSNWIAPTTLEGKIVKLVPLEISHKDGLIDAVSDGNLSELWYTSVPNNEAIDKYIEVALSEQENGKSLPFVVVENSSGKIVGATRYLNIETEHRRLEIGYTFMQKAFNERVSIRSANICCYSMRSKRYNALQLNSERIGTTILPEMQLKD